MEIIGDSAFSDCHALTTVSLPAATSIGDSAFAYCYALTTVSLPATLITISGNPFRGCRNLAAITVAPGNPNYSAQDGMLLNKAGITLIAYPGATGAVTLNTATSIGDQAFSNCDTLTTVSLPAATSIGTGAFGGCAALPTVSLPAATDIGDYTFAGSALPTVSLPAATDIGSHTFAGTGGNAITVTLGSAASTLGGGMFSSVDTAKTVTVKVPSGATGYGTLGTIYSGSDSTVTWGNGFRGKGWDGSGVFSSGATSINSYITLTIQVE